MSPLKRPPGPSSAWLGLPLARAFQTRPLEFIDSLRPYGDVVYFPLLNVQAHVFNHPDLIREVLVTRAKQTRKAPRLVRVLAQVDGNGLINSEGDFWRRQRRLVQPAFASKRLDRYASISVDYTRRMLDRWKPGERLNVVDVMTHLTLEIIARTLFDVEVSGQAAHLGEAVHVLSEVLTREFGQPFVLPMWLPTPGMRRERWALQTLDDLIRGIIRQRRAAKDDRGDLLSMLLLAVDEEGDGGQMTDQQARDEAITLFNAGHDTTAAALAWIWDCLARHPQVEERARQEVASVLGDRPATFADVARLTYVGCVIRETLRLYPPTWAMFPRVATEDLELAGYRVPRGGWLYMFPWLTHRDERFFPNPLTFDPDRFAPGRAEQIPQYAWFPFGGGPHVCIGKEFALMETTLIVATVLQRYRLELPSDAPPTVPEALVAVRPRDGLLLTVRPQA